MRSKRVSPEERNATFTIVFLVALISFAGAAVFIFRYHIFEPAEHIILSLKGSTTLGDELMPKLAEGFLRNEMGATQTGVKIAAKDANGHSRMDVWGAIPGRPGLQVIRVDASESSTAFECLAATDDSNACDIGMASRPISLLDKERFPAIATLGDRPTEHVVALDAIAIIVNPHNPLSQLSIPQLRAIYTKQVTNWKELGGNDAPIEIFGRDRDSGTFEMFTEKVIGRDTSSNANAFAVRPDHQIGDSSLMVDAVMRSANAVGYVSSPMVRGAKALRVSDGIGPAFSPTELSIVTEDYPICRRLLLYERDAPGTLMDAFVRYVVYKPGQRLVSQTPFVELTPKVFPVLPPQDAPASYKDIASKYSRIGLSFHFLSEQTEAAADSHNQLDNFARINILRLRTFLAQHGGTGDDIVLLGFADEHEVNRNLALKRAESVATSLRGIGVVVPRQNVRDFGANLPVASNNTPEGMQKNRRVEVWVRNGLG